VTVARSGIDGLAAARAALPDVVLLDLFLPDGTGLEVFEQLRALDARLPVIFITVAKSAETAIEAMKRGAYDYIYKPLDLAQLQSVAFDALEMGRRMRAPVSIRETAAEDVDDSALIGTCPGMREVYKAIGRVAQQDVTVLITGESGTGKELVARAIYQHSARSREPFLALNCAAIPDQLLESELFGHERGAFTGAERRRIGKFEQYSGGTILLDEIGDMAPSLQVKILRLLQEQSFERVGGSEVIRTDVRLIAATHRDLKSMVAEETFRLDLYYRLGVFAIQVPPLRERGEDIALLSERYVRRFSRELGRHVCEIAPETMELLRAYHWPGNVRELQSVLKQAVLYSRGFTLLPTFLPRLSAGAPRGSTELEPVASPRPRPASPGAIDLEAFVRHRLGALGPGELYAETRQLTDRFLLTTVLERTKGNLGQAAEVLGISRQTMRVKLRALGISVAHAIEVDED
jgi:two-component system nitrogen regulation response regulator GlnG